GGPMKITVLSGKGGTGKTTVATNLALSLENVQLMDADVEEPDDYIFIEPNFQNGYEAVNRLIPVINDEKCTACRKCVDFCEYNALALMLDNVLVFPEICHSCGGCARVCPVDAITEKEREVGRIRGDTSNRNLEFWQGELNIGEEVSVPVIEQLKEHINEDKTVIIDAQPGTTCPTIEAAIDSDFCILVTEPTPFGLNDLRMAVEVIEGINKPAGVVINRAEEEHDHIIEDYLQETGIPVLMKIPFERRIAELYSTGIPFVKEWPEWQEKFINMYSRIRGLVDNEKNYNYQR
ncbi:MAG: ATP-binding protein, partial [Halanaerobiaceae bacterium]